MLARDTPPHLSSRHLSHPANPAAPSSSSPRPTTSMNDEHDDASEENIFRDMTFEEILEDLNARFLINLPREEMNLVRIYWQAEQASVLPPFSSDITFQPS